MPESFAIPKRPPACSRAHNFGKKPTLAAAEKLAPQPQCRKSRLVSNESLILSTVSHCVLRRLVSPRHTVGQPEAIGPSVLHPQDHSYRENQDKPLEPAILPQMHEKQKR